MNKYCWFIIITTLLFIGCRDNFSRSFEFKINNDTSNDIYVQMTGFTYPPLVKDTICKFLAKNEMFSTFVRLENLNRTMWKNYDYDNVTIFNLIDTSKIFGSFAGGYLTDNNGLTDRYEYILGEFDTSVILTLTITDSLLSFFTKDYTMLEKFKDYYSTPH